jgi:putative transposase
MGKNGQINELTKGNATRIPAPAARPIREMTTRDIQAHLHEIYQSKVSPDLISTLTNGVREEVIKWQFRPVDSIYPIKYLDALRVKVRDEGQVKNKTGYPPIFRTVD